MMKRREFVKTATLAGGALALSLGDARPAAAATKYHLRYAPRLDFLSRELSIPQRLETFAQHGFDATEYNGLTNHPPLEVEEIRKKMESLEMGLGIFVANPAGWNKAGLVDPKQRGAFVEQLNKAIEYHKVIGNNFCTVITGPEIPGVPRGVQRRNVIDGLKQAAEILEKTELTIVIEPLNVLVDHAGYFLVHSDEAAEIMAAVGSSHVKILFDIYHQQISEGNLINNIRRYYEFIGYFQVGDVPGRKEPGTGEINWRNVFKAIYDLGYRGIVGMEHGLSQPGMAGLLKCFEEYKKADTWG
ncbi:MAG: TIM barrel protein [Acidobacteria bacterium]|nr:TIM barrel protein [Acidobacteriota bacterium]